MFNILTDLFFILSDVDIANYADGNPPFVIADDINGVIAPLAKASKVLFEWFENNLLKSNADKSSVIRQKGESENGCYKNTKHDKFFERRTFLTP